MDWFEATGLVSGLLCVALLIRQSIWNWPIGLVYALVSVVVFFRTQLYADLALHVYYCAMNAYGWYYWQGGRSKTHADLPVTQAPRTTLLALTAAIAAATAIAGWWLGQRGASFPYWDSAGTAMSLSALWLQTRKYIDNWYLWLVVDVIYTVIYYAKGIELYAVLYCVYIAMAIAGWAAWRRTMA